MKKLSLDEVKSWKTICDQLQSDDLTCNELRILFLEIKNSNIATRANLEEMMNNGIPIYDQLMEIIDYNNTREFNDIIDSNQINFNHINIAMEAMLNDPNLFG